MTVIEKETQAAQKRFAAWLDNRVNYVKIKMRTDWYLRNVLAEVKAKFVEQSKNLKVKE